MGIRSQGWRLDYRKFKSHLQSKWHVTKAFLFIGYLEEQQKMYKDLREMGYTIVFKPTVMRGEEVKGNVDVELVLQAMSDWDKYRQAVVISGDGDFYSLVKHLLDKNKLATLIVPNSRKYSQLYGDLPDTKIEFMDKLRAELTYHPRAVRKVE